MPVLRDRIARCVPVGHSPPSFRLIREIAYDRWNAAMMVQELP